MSASSWTAALQPLGWTLVLVLWQTVLLALLLSASGRLRRPSAQRRHRDALVALLAALPLGVLTFCTLAHAPEPLRDAATGAWRRIAFSHDAEPQVAEVTSQPVSAFTRGPAATSRSLPDGESGLLLAVRKPRLLRAAGGVIPWGAALWALIAVIMVGRLAGGHISPAGSAGGPDRSSLPVSQRSRVSSRDASG